MEYLQQHNTHHTSAGSELFNLLFTEQKFPFRDHLESTQPTTTTEAAVQGNPAPETSRITDRAPTGTTRRLLSTTSKVLGSVHTAGQQTEANKKESFARCNTCAITPHTLQSVRPVGRSGRTTPPQRCWSADGGARENRLLHNSNSTLNYV